MIILTDFIQRWIIVIGGKKLHAQSVGSPLSPHSLIFEKSMAVPDMTPELVIGHTVFLYVL